MNTGSWKQTERGMPELYYPPIEATAILDRNGIIQWVSPSIYDLLGFQHDELEGIEIFRLLHCSTPQKVKFQFQAFQHHKQMMNEGLKQFRNKQGEKIALLVSLSNLLAHPAINGILLHLHLYKGDEKPTSSSSRQQEAEIENKVCRKALQEIAAELHDNIGSSLIGAKLIFDHALKNPIKNYAELGKVSEIMNALVRDVRNLSHGIIMENPGNFVLHERLHMLLENIRKTKTIRFLLKSDRRLEGLLQHEQKIEIFRILQEQVSNIVKHSEATKALIVLQIVDGKVKITTRDNGKGFNVCISQPGIGLSNILFRVNKLQGHLQINSKPGAGTMIWFVFCMNQL